MLIKRLVTDSPVMYNSRLKFTTVNDETDWV
jgi:hypothetical protein